MRHIENQLALLANQPLESGCHCVEVSNEASDFVASAFQGATHADP
jgi:hypothetical protein